MVRVVVVVVLALLIIQVFVDRVEPRGLDAVHLVPPEKKATVIYISQKRDTITKNIIASCK